MAPRASTPPAPAPAALTFDAPGRQTFAPGDVTAPPEVLEPVLPEQAVLVVAVEGEQTADLRVVDALALTWREPPLSLTRNHDDDRVVGRIDVFGRTDTLEGLTVETFAAYAGETGRFVIALATFDLEGDDGREAARQVEDGFLLGVSMEVGDEQIEWECIATEEDVDTGEAWCVEYLMHLTQGRIGAVTVCPFQALEVARVIATDTPDEAAQEEAAAALAASAVTAVQHAAARAGASWYAAPNPFTRTALIARGAPLNMGAAAPATHLAPPAEWFTDPQLSEPTPLTITADGRVFGHIAAWGTCHIGRDDVCITPPHSVTGYAHFQTGEVVCAAGERVPVGVFTMGTGHAELDATPAATVSHYDHTGTQAAVLAAGEDEHGIWVAGALHNPDLSPGQLTVLRAAAPSGDWRRIGGNLELVGVLAVNVPGFPIPRPRTLVSGGAQLALVAAAAPQGHGDCGCGGTVTAGGSPALDRRLRRVEAVITALGLDAQAGDALAASITG
jgi:hypothetical protein